MARQVVGNPFDNQIPTVSPTAQIVDTYYRVQPERSPLAGIAESLQRFKAKAQQPLANMENRAIERELAEGENLYNETRLNIGEAVKQGIIAEGESPYIIKGYRMANLNVLAARYADQLNNDLIAKKLYKTNNPSSIEEYTASFYDNFASKNGLDQFKEVEVAEIFSDSARKANESFRNSWIVKNREWQAAQAYTAFENEIAEYTATFFNDTDTVDIRANKTELFGKWLTNKIAEADKDGLNRDKVKATVIKAMMLTASEQTDLGLVDVLDSVQVGTGILGNTLDARLAMDRARTSIAAQIARDEKDLADSLKAQKDQKIAVQEGAALSAIFGLRADATDATAQQSFNSAIVQLTELGDYDSVRVYTNFRDAMVQQGIDESDVDDKNYALALSQITELTDSKAVVTYLTNAVNSNLIGQSTAGSLISQWERLKTSPSRFVLTDTTTSVPRIRTSFLKQVTITPLDEAVGTTGILLNRAETAWDNAYLEAYDAKKLELRRELDAREKRALAVEVSELVADEFVDPETLSIAEQTLMAIQTPDFE
ncbi:hypothetical protein CRP171_gp35 [Roseobacter phage CRP-171]|uniref:Coil containing protein n=1 Tax=Roseobacter phage CRP-171 TaxID=3072846 RepID=A0AAX3ZVK4_9CAUD|nr:hypothetical protein CRP171_gp35 [Roseobacter phage CRP-171]